MLELEHDTLTSNIKGPIDPRYSGGLHTWSILKCDCENVFVECPWCLFRWLISLFAAFVWWSFVASAPGCVPSSAAQYQCRDNGSWVGRWGLVRTISLLWPQIAARSEWASTGHSQGGLKFCWPGGGRVRRMNDYMVYLKVSWRV